MRPYPAKLCQECGRSWQPQTRYQAARNLTCSLACANARIARARRGPKPGPHKTTTVPCSVCGQPTTKPDAWLRRVAEPMCSRECNGKRRAGELVKHSHKGRAAWTEESKASYREKMTGANNPAWKGGVCYRHRKGNYTRQIKYVRCPPEFLPMARKDGYVMEHRLIVARQLGRPLARVEVVHHLDHDPTNNQPSNLMLFPSNGAHKRAEPALRAGG